MYVGMDFHMPRLGDKKDEKEKKDEVREKNGKENKKMSRRVEDGLLLVVPARIYGKPVKALIDSGATRDKVVWRWGDTEQNSFLALKAAMATVPVLPLPDFERQFVVMTDASDVAIGAILEQDFGSGVQPIAFSSRKLNGTEIRYSAYERELLGIVWAIDQWKHYLQGPYPIVIQTDHAPLRYLPN